MKQLKNIIVKIVALYIAALIILNGSFFGGYLLSWIFDSQVTSQAVLYSYDKIKDYSDVKDVIIDSDYASITVKRGDKFQILITSKKKKIDIKKKDGLLKINLNRDLKFIRPSDSDKIEIYLDKELDSLKIIGGLGPLEVKDIKVKSLDLNQGIGSNKVSNVEVEEGKIEGGIGNLEVLNSKFKKLNIDSGIGSLNMSLTGNYTYSLTKGLGEIRYDNELIKKDSILGDGENKVTIEGGIGNIKIKTREMDK